LDDISAAFRSAKACVILWAKGVTSLSNPAHSPRLMRFGQFELDLRTAEIYKDGKRIKLQEQPCQVLALLIERPGVTAL
jgi:DNA-binding response OmpR family regulator